MADGAYVALNGMRARLAELDRIAGDLANVNTFGYKGHRSSTFGSDRATFDAVLQKATDPTPGEPKVDLTPGEITGTGNDLDFALEGRGFFVVETPAGPRYTRNGSFKRDADGTLTTTDGMPVLDDGNGHITIGAGEVTVDADGTLRVNGASVGQLQIVEPGPNATIAREGAARFKIDSIAPVETPKVSNHAIEQSNVSVVELMARMTGVSRNFDALQRGLISLASEVDGRAISELGRRG